MRFLLFVLLTLGSADTGAQTSSRFSSHALAGNFENIAASASTNQMRCVRKPALFSIAAATHLSAFVSQAFNPSTTGLAVYPDSDGGTVLAKTSQSSNAVGVITGTVSSFALTAGTPYRWCVCATNTGVQLTGTSDGGTNSGGDSRVSALWNAGTTRMFAATNACDGTNGSSGAGNPPTTTGTISAAASIGMPIILVE